MVTNGKLLIFENFEVNLNLPKWRRTEEAKESADNFKLMGPPRTRRSRMMSSEQWEGEKNTEGFENTFTLDGSTSTVVSSFSFANPSATVSSLGDQINVQFVTPGPSISWWSRMVTKLKGKFRKKLVVPPPPVVEKPQVEVVEIETRYSIEEFFKELKVRGQNLKVVAGRIKDFEKVLEYVKSTHQAALQERIEDVLGLVRAETSLLSVGLKTVIPEAMVVEFHKKCEEKQRRALKLDWIKNFARLIPEKLVDMKTKCDELEIFDNYVVLHYDPKDTGTVLTKAEIEKKKDPILFGVISGSRNLYYIGDWVDQYCNLTLRAFIEEFGKDSVRANDISTHIKVDDFSEVPG